MLKTWRWEEAGSVVFLDATGLLAVILNDEEPVAYSVKVPALDGHALYAASSTSFQFLKDNLARPIYDGRKTADAVVRCIDRLPLHQQAEEMERLEDFNNLASLFDFEEWLNYTFIPEAEELKEFSPRQDIVRFVDNVWPKIVRQIKMEPA